MKMKKNMLAGVFSVLVAAHAGAVVTVEEAKQLGTTLTPWGAEKGGNKEGTIPPYTGGLTKAPAGITIPANGLLPDPYGDEKPLFSINAKNVNQYAAQLTPGQIELIRRFPTYRMDVYTTHRSFPEMPKVAQQNAIKNATNPACKTSADGVGLQGCWGGIPFPIPKSGYEAMWNQNLRWRQPCEYRALSFLVTPNAEVMINDQETYTEYPYWEDDVTPYSGAGQYYQRLLVRNQGPARDAGNGTMIYYPLQLETQDQRTWSYTVGQRRVRLAPEFSYDTPAAQMGGAMNYDEIGLFSGKMDRYDFKLVGKQEKFVPSNTYRFVFGKNKEAILGKQHLNPDAVRYELRRVWVVEATLKPGKRHVAPKRTFYIDEDSWTILAADTYDSSGKLSRVQEAYAFPEYKTGSWFSLSAFTAYDLTKSQYAAITLIGVTAAGYYRTLPSHRPERALTPETLATSGLR